MKKLLILAICAIAAGCEWMPLQKGESYDGGAIDPYTDITVMEYIESRSDLFSNLHSMILELDLQDLYTGEDRRYTYLLLTNAAISSTDVQQAKDDPAKRTEWTNTLKFHIIQGMYHSYGTLNYTPTYVVTLWEDPMAIMSLVLFKSTSDRNATGRVRAMEQCGTSDVRSCTASDHFFKSGVAHIFPNRLVYKK